MNRIILTPLLILLIASCSEPRRVYNDGATIPEDSAVYKLSEELKRRRQAQSTRVADQAQKVQQSTSTKFRDLENSHPLAKIDPQDCNGRTELSCSLDNFSNRDAGWADPLEVQIREALALIPNVSKANFISVHCGRTICEATGQIYQQIPTFSKEESFTYLEEKMFSENLADANAIPVEVRIIRPSGEFTVIFERVRQ